MQNIFILESLLYFLKQSQKKKQFWVKFKFTKFLFKIIKILAKSKLISGYIIQDTTIIIFLKYFNMEPLIKTYKIFSKPTKKNLLTKKEAILLKKENPQSFFFIININNIQQLTITNKISTGILLFQIN